MNVALSGTLTVARPPGSAFELFTPRGEQLWAEGWQPRFPASTPDDSAPGTVFETDANGRTTTWVVTDRTPGHRIRYARVVPGLNAGTVTVELSDTPAGGGSDVRVSYELTALTAPGRDHLRDFITEYDAMLRDWSSAIAAHLRASDQDRGPLAGV